MAGQVFFLKEADTLPILEVFLLKPDGSAMDLTGFTACELHVLLSSGDTISRTMAIDPSPALGRVTYAWQASDWTSGDLTSGPPIPLHPGEREHRMEYEVTGPGGARLTFPNDGYDVLRVWAELGQA